MTLITEAEVRSLASLRGRDAIVSCYLDVDGRRHLHPADYERSLAVMVQRARANGHGAAISADLDRITARVADGFDRSKVRGVAMFAGVADDVWEVVELPVPVRDQIVANVSPAVGQLEGILEESLTLGVLLTDRVRARVTVHRLDEVLYDEALDDEDEGRGDVAGLSDRGTPDRHRDEKAKAHLRRASDLLWSVHQQFSLDHVLIGASDKAARPLVDGLHPYLRARMHAVVDLDPAIGDAVLRDTAHDAILEIERRREQRLVDDLRAALGAGAQAVEGLSDVLDAMHAERVATLLVSTGYSESGWACPNCGRLATVGPTCDCGNAYDKVDNVVERAIERGIERGITVEMCTDNADLDVHGRIGALLRY